MLAVNLVLLFGGYGASIAQRAGAVTVIDIDTGFEDAYDRTYWVNLRRTCMIGTWR